MNYSLTTLNGGLDRWHSVVLFSSLPATEPGATEIGNTTMKVHHATAAKATKLGISILPAESHFDIKHGKLALVALDAKQGVEDMVVLKMLAAEYPKLKIEQDGEDWVVYPNFKKDADPIGSGPTLQDAWDEASEASDEGEGSEDEETSEGKSVVKRKYKRAYRPFKQTCGDDISKLISKHLLVKDDETGEMKIDEKKLVRFAKLNDAWVDSYKDLNVGMRRMNVANRIRAKVKRDDYKIVWG